MSPYIPTRPVPQEWLIQNCPHCEIAIHSSKVYNMRRALAMHLSKFHRDMLPPEPEPLPPFKVIAIVAVYPSRVRAQYAGIKSVTVSSAFPGQSGVIVVRPDGRLAVYAKFSAGEKSYTPVELDE